MKALLARTKSLALRLFAKLRVFDWRDLLLVFGVGSIFHGVYMLKPALAYIVLGCACVWISVFTGRK